MCLLVLSFVLFLCSFCVCSVFILFSLLGPVQNLATSKSRYAALSPQVGKERSGTSIIKQRPCRSCPCVSFRIPPAYAPQQPGFLTNRCYDTIRVWFLRFFPLSSLKRGTRYDTFFWVCVVPCVVRFSPSCLSRTA